jgi:hypothetical protein
MALIRTHGLADVVTLIVKSFFARSFHAGLVTLAVS